MWMIRWLFRLIGLAIILACITAIAAGGMFALYVKESGLAAEKSVVIPKESGIRDIYSLLKKEGVVDIPEAVFIGGAVAFKQQHLLKAGEYAFALHMSARAVVELLASGKVVIHQITLVEGTTVYQALQALKAESALVGDVPATVPEGSLLPETYNFNRGDSRSDIIARMQKAQKDVLNAAWANRAPNLPLKTQQEALVLASIVEKETGLAAERPKVAGVFINRLNMGMKLQSDPTAIYPLSNKTGDLGRPLTYKDLATPSPYNTYYTIGLPPTPIANVGKAAIEAVLHPASHNYVYFVADGSGGHAFAATLDEHNRNVAAWRKIQK